MENELAIQQQGALTARDIRAQVNLIQEVMKSVMKDGMHYGDIPGCAKPSLFKAGAEKIAATFRIAIKSTVEDLSTPDEKHFRVTCTGYSPAGLVLGSAVGECTSNEEKFKWRSPVCDQEFAECDGDRKREKWAKSHGGTPYKKKQIRTDPADLSNTILQLADKRAYVAVVRKITAASDVFTQDIEDLPPELQADLEPGFPTSTKPAVAMPQSKSGPAPQPETPTQGKNSPQQGQPGEKISDKQGKRLYAIARGVGMTEEVFREWLYTKFGYERTDAVEKAEYEKICTAAEGWKNG